MWHLQERHKREVAEQDFEKASKAAAAEQARQDREQARLKEQQEVQQRLAAHKQGVRAAKTRVDRAALHSLGEAFAARLQVGWQHHVAASCAMQLHCTATDQPWGEQLPDCIVSAWQAYRQNVLCS